MSFVTEGWQNGPSSKREFLEPANVKKDHILFTIFGMVYFVFFIVWELGLAMGSYVWKLLFKPEPKSLKRRVCLVTGSGRGLGRELCLALAKEGAVVACADINEPNNRTTATMIEELGGQAVPYTLNVAIKKDVEDLVSRIERELGPIYLLINNAAVVYTTSKINEEFIRACINVNFLGPVWMMNAVLPTMTLRNEGHIVNICSVSSRMVLTPLNLYGATKASLTYMTNGIRAELQLANENNKVIVTAVHPSLMNTSEDYLRCMSLKINIVIEMEEVVKETMRAIHYGHEEVFVPSIMKYPLLLVNEMMPSRTSTKLMRLVFEKWTLPDEQQQKHLPWNDLIKECSLIEKANGRQ